LNLGSMSFILMDIAISVSLDNFFSDIDLDPLNRRENISHFIRQ
jgi:hypothetical protein